MQVICFAGLISRVMFKECLNYIIHRVYENSKKDMFRSIKFFGEVQSKLKSKGFCATRLSTDL